MADTRGALVWVVSERSEIGDTTVGVYATLEEARSVVDSFGREHLHAYRIEGQVIGEGKDEPTPWHVGLTRQGDLIGATPFAGCSCHDDEAEYFKRSFIEDGGERMYVMVLARTPGQAIIAARKLQAWLRSNGVWQHSRVPLHPIWPDSAVMEDADQAAAPAG